MSRTTLCVVTALSLMLISASIAVVRVQVMGQETRVPAGSGHFKVTLVTHGKSTGDARLITACPLDMGRQHIFGEDHSSDELYARIVEGQKPGRRSLHWTQRVAAPKGAFQARYQFFCNVHVHRPSTSMTQMQKALYAPPRPGEHLSKTPGIDPSHPEVTRVALDMTAGMSPRLDQVRKLYEHVAKAIDKEPSAGQANRTAAMCLEAGRGDALAKSRLLVALCRNRGIPARLVTGVALGNRNEQTAHVWVEAWVGDYWMSMCPYYHYFLKVPATYLVFGYGDMSLVRGHNVRNLDYAFLVEHSSALAQAAQTEDATTWEQFFRKISLYSLPPAEWRLVEFLLLLPIAALIICFYRNVIGLHSFGTFAPALIGLAFRHLESMPGILVFVSIVLIGWGMRRVLDRYHLLQVPRTAFMLSLVVLVLIGSIVAANYQDLAVTRYISLFPIIILTGMIERFWTLEAEDGTVRSFKTLLGTLIIAATIALTASAPFVLNHMVNFPETLGIIMACQLLIGRYTGYRLSELYRFRDLVRT
ncbi:MAG: hypothetical protein FJ271_03200 [Planctomycetes bacterium]|nr:hypothetical protein [Planctomycetota bacterium]